MLVLTVGSVLCLIIIYTSSVDDLILNTMYVFVWTDSLFRSWIQRWSIMHGDDLAKNPQHNDLIIYIFLLTLLSIKSF